VKKNSFTFLISTILTTCVFSAANSQTEQSYIAPLVDESLLLDISKGNTLIVVGERGHILVGDELNQVSVPTKATLTAVTSIDDAVWAVGHDASILKSDDAGQSWKILQQAPELDRPLMDVHFFDAQEGIAVGAYGLFYRSEDGGDTWTQERHPSVLSVDDKEYLESIKDDQEFYIEELYFISPHFNRLYNTGNILYVAGEAGLIASSTDQGRNWERLDISYQGSFFDVAQLSSGDVFAVGLRGNMFLLNNGQWKPIQSCVTTSLNSIIVNEDTVYVAGNNGVVLSIDTQLLNSDKPQTQNSEGCARHGAVKQLDTDFSDAISDARLVGKSLLMVTSGGLQTLGLGE
jgi:photosystem II stability/assembly factor-like uncharacterized protein